MKRSPAAERCRTARIQAGLSRGQAERRTGIVRLDGIEAGRMPTDEEWRAMAEAYGVAIEWLRDGQATPIAEETVEALMNANIYPADRDGVLELLSTMPRSK